MSTWKFLVVIETRHVKEFLMASTYIRETRGGSLLLDRLNRVETALLLDDSVPHQKVYLGGGSGRILFGEEQAAEEFAEAVRQLYQRATTTASVSVQVLGREPDEPIAQWMSRGVEKARWVKNAGPGAEPLLAGRWIRPCTSCGKEPAWKTTTDIHGAHSLCGACHAKRTEIREFYRDPKNHTYLGFTEDPIPDLATLREHWKNSILTTVAEKLQEQKTSEDGAEELRLRLPQDFNLIGEESTPKGYFAFIYADANQMGQVIRSMPEAFPNDEALVKAYGSLSRIVDQATREAAAQAVLEAVLVKRETWKPKKGTSEPMAYLPAEFVIAGGDDLILIVPAHAGLPVAGRFVELFQKKTVSLQEEEVQGGDLDRLFAPEGLATSAGVVFCHATFPASLLLDLAGELLKMAKKKAASTSREEGRPVGTVDFMVLPDSGSEGAKRRRRDEYEGKLPLGQGKVLRTERPYTVGGLQDLMTTVRSLRQAGVPRNKLQSLYGTLFRNSPFQTQFDALRIKERLQATGALDQGPLRDWVQTLDLFPFRRSRKADGREDWVTPLSEVVEAYDFIPLEEPGGPDSGATPSTEETP